MAHLIPLSKQNPSPQDSIVNSVTHKPVMYEENLELFSNANIDTQRILVLCDFHQYLWYFIIPGAIPLNGRANVGKLTHGCKDVTGISFFVDRIVISKPLFWGR
jgi:hypothetical protein